MSDWSVADVESLKAGWIAGTPASKIGKALGRSRNAVIGKVHRLGLSGRAAPSQPSRTTFKAPRAPRPTPAPAPRRVEHHSHSPALPTQPVFYPEEPGSATVLTLGAHIRAYISQRFCGTMVPAAWPVSFETVTRAEAFRMPRG